MIFIGRNPARILLLTDRAIHIATRKFTKRRFKKLIVSYPLHTVPVSWDDKALHIGDRQIYLNGAGFQLGGLIGTQQDMTLFLDDSDPSR
jgi:hypothetical protein